MTANFPGWLTMLSFSDTLTGYLFSAYNSRTYYSGNGGITWALRPSAPFSQTHSWFSDKNH
ncbi:MAG: hypothetical protein WCL00_09745, partial [Bacteroidota bacterium]